MSYIEKFPTAFVCMKISCIRSSSSTILLTSIVMHSNCLLSAICTLYCAIFNLSSSLMELYPKSMSIRSPLLEFCILFLKCCWHNCSLVNGYPSSDLTMIPWFDHHILHTGLRFFVLLIHLVDH